jgi:acylphosphatase
MQRRVKIFVSGRVQGVYFRAFTKKQAKQLALNGWAKNLEDGRVEIVAEGNEAAIEKLIQWSQKGPMTARVDQIETVELEADGELNTFIIL